MFIHQEIKAIRRFRYFVVESIVCIRTRRAARQTGCMSLESHSESLVSHNHQHHHKSQRGDRSRDVDRSGRGPRATGVGLRGATAAGAGPRARAERDRFCFAVRTRGRAGRALQVLISSYCLAFEGGASKTHISSVQCVSQAIPLASSLPVPRMDAASMRENRDARNRNAVY